LEDCTPFPVRALTIGACGSVLGSLGKPSILDCTSIKLESKLAIWQQPYPLCGLRPHLLISSERRQQPAIDPE
jgi:hypothetical protein